MATLNSMGNGFMAMLPLIGIGIAVFLVFWMIASFTRKGIERYTSKREKYSGAAIAFSRLAYIGIIFFGLMVAVTVAFPSITPARLFSALGIGGVAIGFAFKDIFQNLLAGILILVRQPFKVGDEITSGEFTGTVENIETRATFIRTYDGKRIIVPNSRIYTEPVTVISAYDILRSEYDVGIGYGDDVGEARKFALEAVKGVEGVLSDPAPDVLLWDLAGFSQNLRVRWWTDPVRGNVVQVKDRVLETVAKRLSEAGIDLPFPTNVVLFHDQTEAIDGDRTKQREGWPAGNNPPEARPIGSITNTNA
ncbi:MAG: mechanosensitive ion channel family protein [Rhizobium sp.]|jgi:small conductance mechanosensitive channel|nr:mechanosensitive ion channel family protein [Rhizobium sp.]